jgi:hypothetical protein
VKDSIENILNGIPVELQIQLLLEDDLDGEIDDDTPLSEIEALIEKRICRRGPAIKRRIRGRIVTMHKRICRGKPNVRASMRARKSARRSKNTRRRAQAMRWRIRRR